MSSFTIFNLKSYATIDFNEAVGGDANNSRGKAYTTIGFKETVGVPANSSRGYTSFKNCKETSLPPPANKGTHNSHV